MSTDPITPERIAELRQKLSLVAAEPWRTNGPFDIDCPGCGECCCMCDVTSEDEYQTAYIQVCGLQGFAEPVSDLIVAMKNSLPVLLDEIERLRESVNRDAVRCGNGHIGTVEDWGRTCRTCERITTLERELALREAENEERGKTIAKLRNRLQSLALDSLAKAPSHD